ncbi:MAG: zinc ribbon domain-containing protein [Methanofollis sp.]|uniref:zinc ribbon domain-containing protein n=1 Tax=Methanofollis sp. TaxID=2052835 RepID=UPI0026394D29|nr:zinc ribbon domain-containing protein [Methanofollis sp.]MDD4254237.1 zinc ribbon domain-containing protein [Methanofollis sp.]
MSKFCPECGKEQISQNAEICPNCGVRIKKNPEKSSGIAAISSFVFAGLGQVYNGDFGRGFLILVGTVIGSMFYFIPGLFVWAYGIYDAYTTAKRMNAGEIPYQETNALHMILFVVLWFVGIAVFFILAAIVAAFVFGMSGSTYY